MAVKKQETEAAVQAAPEKDTEVIRLFKDNQRYKTPVFVGVNGETCLLYTSGQGKNGTIGYIYGHKERACIETRNLSQPEELAPSDTKWSRRQLRKGCTECAENAYWWEQHYPGFEVVQVMIYDPGQLYEADRPRPDGWEATEAQAYLILRRRGFAKVRT